MKLRSTIKSALFVLLLWCCSSAHSQNAVKLASDEWCPYVCVENGRIVGGFLVEVTAQAMHSSGYNVEPVLLPFSRAMDEATAGYVQGVFSPPSDNRLNVSTPIILAHSCFYTLSKQNWVFQGLSSLQSVKLGVIPNYNYDDGNLDAYIERNRYNKMLIDMAYGEYAGMVNLNKLLASRFLVMVEDEAVMSWLLRKSNAADKVRQAGCIDTPISVTIGFSKADPHSDDLMHALNYGLQQLESSGKLQSLKQQYQIPTVLPNNHPKY